MVKTIVQRARDLGPLFLITIVIPTFCAIIYYGLIASDVYISESRFVVRSPDKPDSNGLGFLLKSSGFSNAGDQSYAVQDFVQSRDALKVLNHGGTVAQMFTRPHIDMFDRFGVFSDRTNEELFRYFKGKLRVEHDAAKSITTLTVKAYTAQDARWLNEKLLEQGEGLVNRLNERGRLDQVSYAQAEVARAKAEATDAALAVAVYRDQQGIIDPEKQAAVNLQLISKLQDELIATRTQLVQLRALAPQNPQIEVLQVRAKELAKEIDGELGQVAGGKGSLAGAAAQYQRLQLENEFAGRQLASALTLLADGQKEAGRKQVYVERIVQPSLPDKALQPRRWRGVFASFALGIVAYLILSMLAAGLREHKD